MSCVAYYKERDFTVSALFVDYGQISSGREGAAAQAIAHELNIPLARVSTSGLSIPSGEITGRNALLLTTALMAFPGDCGLISLGIHAGTTYDDCSPSFIDSMQHVFDVYADGRVQADAPFLHLSKDEIYEYAISRRLPLELTYSCELGLTQPCGGCISCRDIEALHAR